MRRLLSVAAVVGGVLSLGMFLPTTGSAAPIFDNGTPGTTVGGTDITYYFLADDFTLTQPATVNLVRFWNIQGLTPGCCYNNSITWAIYSDNSSTHEPGAPLAGPTNTAADTRTLTRTVNGGNSYEYQNDVALPAVQLGPGTYWIALHNGPLATNGFVSPDLAFYWEFGARTADGTGGDFPGRVCHPPNTATNCLATTDWSPYSNTEYEFQLYAVPEPSTLLLTGAVLPGLAGALIRRRRRSKIA